MGWFIRYIVVLGIALVLVPTFLRFYTSREPLPVPEESIRAPQPEQSTPADTVTESRDGLDMAANIDDSGGSSVPEDAVAQNETGSRVSGSNFIVWGHVETTLGRIVPGEEVRLVSRSRGKRYEFISNDQGEFVVNGVLPADDYELTVEPKGMYKKYRRFDLALNEDETTIEVVLEPLRTALLQVRVVNTQNQPVSGLFLSVRSLSKKLGVMNAQSDSVGVITIDNFPEGPFEVVSHEISLLAKGLVFNPEDSQVMTLLVDKGPHTLKGRVLDPDGQEAAGATVLLSWSQSRNGVQSTVKRLVLSGPSGAFEISGLGEGEHQLEVSYNYQFDAQRNVFIGTDTPELVVYLVAK